MCEMALDTCLSPGDGTVRHIELQSFYKYSGELNEIEDESRANNGKLHV